MSLANLALSLSLALPHVGGDNNNYHKKRTRHYDCSAYECTLTKVNGNPVMYVAPIKINGKIQEPEVKIIIKKADTSINGEYMTDLRRK